MGILGRALRLDRAAGAKALRQKHGWVVKGHCIEPGTGIQRGKVRKVMRCRSSVP